MCGRGFGGLLQLMGLDGALGRIRDLAEGGEDVPEPLRGARLHASRF